MSSGIYKLIFNNCNLIYIGQSKELEKRFIEHKKTLLNNTASYKLMCAYILYGIPSIEILEYCDTDLDDRELYYITKYNTVESGLNIVGYSIVNPTIQVAKGYMPNGSKYSEEVYYNILMYCIDPSVDETVPSIYISDALEIDVDTVHNVRCLKSHKWLKARFREEYKLLEDKFNNKVDNWIPKIKSTRQINKSLLRNNAAIESSSAPTTNLVEATKIREEKPVEYYMDLESPSGEIFTIKKGDLYKFAKKYKLNYTALNKVLNGKIDHEKGWKLA